MVVNEGNKGLEVSLIDSANEDVGSTEPFFESN